MKCIIVEDQAPARRVLQKFIADSGKIDLLKSFSSANDASNYLKDTSVDLIFLDIHLPTISGLDFLRTLEHPPAIILTTAFDEYALEGYELDIVDYLLKPFSFKRFSSAVDKAEIRISNQKTNSESDLFFIKSGHEYIGVKLSEVNYIHSHLDYTELHHSNGKYLAQETLTHWEKTLYDFQFVRVHKSYLVNVATIQRISGNTIHFSNDASIPIGRAYKEGFLSNYVKLKGS